MALFGRKPKDLPQDESLPALDVDGAAQLTRLSAAWFSDRGRRVVSAEQGVIRLADGQACGLHNLSLSAAQTTRRKWGDLVADHFTALAAAEAESETYPSDPANWYFKLRSTYDLPERPAYAREAMPGILALAAIDTPTRVIEALRDDKPWIADFDNFRRTALANLAKLPAPEHIRMRADDNVAASEVHVFAAGDFFGASRFLVLEQLLRGQLGLERPEHGCLVAAPNRALLIVHPVRSGIALIAAARLMIDMAAGEYDSRPGPLSRHLFYRTADGVEQITRFDEDGAATIDASGRLSAVLSLE